MPATGPLAAFVRCFWFLRGTPQPDEMQPVVPDGRVDLVLHLAEPFALVEPGGIARQASALAAGQLTGPIRLVAHGAADVVGIRFRTARARAVLGLPLDQLTNQVVPLADVAPVLARDLHAAAASAHDPPARARALARVLHARLDAAGHDPLLDHVVAALARDASPPAIAALARRIGVSERTLERRVRAGTGLAPKPLFGVLRFRRAFQLLHAVAPGQWARAALHAGYYDQAHLIRDFRRHAGAPPGAFLAGEPRLAQALLGAG